MGGMHRRKRGSIYSVLALPTTSIRRQRKGYVKPISMLILAVLLISSILYPSLMAEVSTDRGNVINDEYTAAGSDESSPSSTGEKDVNNNEDISREDNLNGDFTPEPSFSQDDLNGTDDHNENDNLTRKEELKDSNGLSRDEGSPPTVNEDIHNNENVTRENDSDGNFTPEPSLPQKDLNGADSQNEDLDPMEETSKDSNNLPQDENVEQTPYVEISQAVKLEYFQPEHEDIIIGEPVRWKEKIIARNTLNETVKGNLSLDLPEGIFDIKICIGNETYHNTSKIWIELGPKEEREIDVEFLTPPVKMEIEYVNVSLSSLLPSEAKNIEVYKNGVLINHYNDTENFSDITIARGKKIRLYHSSLLRYHNVTLEIPVEINKVSVEGDGSYLLKDGALKWNIGELSSSANIAIMPNVERFQGNVTFGKPVEWKVRCGDFVIRYSTPAPVKREFLEKNNEKIYRKRIFVSSNSSLAYRNVKVCTRIPEVRYELQVSFDDLDHQGISYNLLDRDGNSLFDTVEWTISELHQEDYIISVDFNRVRFADRFADHINNYDGTYTAYIYSGPVNYYDKDKDRFLPINTTIENISYNGFEYANLKNNFAVYFDKDKARIMLRYKDCSVIWSIGDQDFGNIQNFDVFVNGSTITYENIFDGIDLRYRVTYDGLCEEIILKKPLDIKGLTERIELSKDCCYEESDGIIYLCSKGSRIFEIKKPFMREENDPAERCYDLHYEIKKDGNIYYITKVIENLSWLKDASREYPVVIDPSIEVDPGSGGNDGHVYGRDANYIRARTIASGYSNSAITLYIGQHKDLITGDYCIYRSFLKFDTSSIPTSATITSAKLKLYGCIDYSSTDFHIRLTKWTGDTPIDTGDYLQFDGTLYDDGSFSTSSFTTSGYNTITISNYNLITKAGYTKIGVLSDRDINGNPPTGNEYVMVYSYEKGSGYRPLLNVTYTVPNNPPSAGYYGGACDIYAGKKVTTIQTEHTDPDGAADVDDCRIRIGDKEKFYFTLQWNVDTDTYSIIDGSDYVSISGCTVTETSITNGYRLTWQFIVDWDFPLDDKDYDVAAWTDDESGADSGYKWDEAGTYTFENDLEVVDFKLSIDSDYDANHDGYIVDDEWFAGGHKITASGKVLYEESDIPFDSEYASSVQVQLFYDTDGDGTPDDLGDTYSDSSISDGTFSITYTPGTSPALQPNASFDVAIQGIPSDGSDVTPADVEITSKRDNEKPFSSVDQISPYWQRSSNITISATASDGNGSGIWLVNLFYRYSSDNSTWSSWQSFGTDSSPPWEWNFTFPNGTGYYEFYSAAKDNVSNKESTPVQADAICGFDNQTPSSSVDTITPYVQTSSPITINATASDDLSGVSNVTLYYRFSTDNSSWEPWVSFGTDTSAPWEWSFDFPNGTGYYEFYSIAVDKAGNEESPPAQKDAMCMYNPSGINHPPVINSIDLRNSTGSKLDGMIDVNKEYYFLINVTDPDGWDDINYINITAWYDNGDESSYYNETPGGNLNLFLQYKNTTGTAEYKLLWPDDEAELILTNCSETIINSTTREIKISFKPRSQFRYAPGDGTWNATQNVTDDLYSWNVNVTVEDNSSARSWMKGEFGVYRYVNIEVPSNWIGVEALPGSYDDSNVVTITFSSNYDYVLSIWFSTNLVNQSTGSTIPIANNVYALASADPNDDITTDTPFSGIGEDNAIEIINASGTFKPDGVSQTVNVQFRVYIPFGTLSGTYKANTRTKIEQKT